MCPLLARWVRSGALQRGIEVQDKTGVGGFPVTPSTRTQGDNAATVERFKAMVSRLNDVTHQVCCHDHHGLHVSPQVSSQVAHSHCALCAACRCRLSA
jgi:hypothetical protein